MEAVRGRKTSGTAEATETWFERFMKLEPAGGFRTAVQQAWRNGDRPSGHMALLRYRNGNTNAKRIEAAA